MIVNSGLSSAELSIVTIVVTIFWVLGLAVHRLWFSRLAKVPGSKLAAITGWVETYHDVFRGGQFVFKIQEWHERYGPIVRINPWEVHIADANFVDTLMASNSKFDKKKEWKYRFGIPHSCFDTIEHGHHRLRRNAIQPFFSKQRVGAIEEFVSVKVQRLCDRMEGEFGKTGAPLILNDCFTAFTFDVITFYTLARNSDYVEHPVFKAPFTDAAKELAVTLHTMGHFPWLLTILQSLPQRLSVALNPTMGAVFAFHGEIENQIRGIKSGYDSSHESVSHRTVFVELLNSTLPPEEKTVERLKHEACSVIAGGIETTATALAKAIFFILSSRHVSTKLLSELEPVFPNPHVTPSLAVLESLPYLSAVIKETLRMTIGLSGRTIRKPHKPVPYKEYVIPEGAYMSMTTYLTHQDASIFEQAREFKPERWLESDQPTATNGSEIPLSKYLVPFGRGPRMCLGTNLAKAELCIGLAVVMRRLGSRMELWRTGREDVDMSADHFIPFVKAGSKGVRVLIH